MAEEKENPVTGPVTDEALAAAFEATMNGKTDTPAEAEAPAETVEHVAETAEPEHEPEHAEELTPEQEAGMTAEELEEHRERSRLGRKLKGVKGLETWMEKQEREMQELKELLRSSVQKPAPAVHESVTEDEAEFRERMRELALDDPVEANRQIRKYDEAKAQMEAQTYLSGYGTKLNSFLKSEVASLGQEEGEQVYREIYDKMFERDERGNEPFNVRYTGNPEIDSEINWSKAKAAVMARKLAEGQKPKYKGRGDETKAPVGPAGTHTSEAPKGKTLPKLSGHAADLAAYLSRKGYSDDKLAGIVKG